MQHFICFKLLHIFLKWMFRPTDNQQKCIRCGGPKGIEPAAGAFMGSRDSWPFQDGIKDLSSLHPVIVANCLDTPHPCNDFFMLQRVINRRHYYYHYYYYYPPDNHHSSDDVFRRGRGDSKWCRPPYVTGPHFCHLVQ